MMQHYDSVGYATVYIDGAIGDPGVCADAEVLIRILPGVGEATVNLMSGFAFVRFDPRHTSHITILNGLIDAGYLDTAAPPAGDGLPTAPISRAESILVSSVEMALV